MLLGEGEEQYKGPPGGIEKGQKLCVKNNIGTKQHGSMSVILYLGSLGRTATSLRPAWAMQ